MGGDLAHAVDRAAVEVVGGVGLGLEADADVFDGA